MSDQNQRFESVSPCGGIILYQWNGVTRHMEVGLTQRAAIVGEGLGITAGGHSNLKQFLRRRLGAIQPILKEAYREGTEELGKVLNRVIPPAKMQRDAQPLGTYMVRVPDFKGCRVHSASYHAYSCTNRERAGLADLEDTDERVGQIRWTTMRWDPRPKDLDCVCLTNAQNQLLPWKGFFHKHEPECVFLKLAQLADLNRLWLK